MNDHSHNQLAASTGSRQWQRPMLAARRCTLPLLRRVAPLPQTSAPEMCPARAHKTMLSVPTLHEELALCRVDFELQL